jgi:hypothetical protein
MIRRGIIVCHAGQKVPSPLPGVIFTLVNLTLVRYAAAPANVYASFRQRRVRHELKTAFRALRIVLARLRACFPSSNFLAGVTGFRNCSKPPPRKPRKCPARHQADEVAANRQEPRSQMGVGCAKGFNALKLNFVERIP